jgi:hypothetical protein
MASTPFKKKLRDAKENVLLLEKNNYGKQMIPTAAKDLCSLLELIGLNKLPH